MKQRQRPAASRFLHRIDDVTSAASASIVVAAFVVGFLSALVFFDLGSTWANGFMVVAAAITLVMVFVIQHTQSRRQVATQLKLDELIRAAPKADDHLVHIEVGSDHELYEQERRQIDHHSAIRDEATSSVSRRRRQR